MKLTKHNGRSGKNGAYNPKHNDREFDLDNSEHIDNERALNNIYWDRFQGYRVGSGEQLEPRLEGTEVKSFEEIEKIFYQYFYGPYLEAQNERHEKARHYDRIRTMDDILTNPKTCPEETILQIGKLEETVSPEVLFTIATEYFEEFEKRYGSHVHIIDWALHVDEGTPHIHERHVFDAPDEYGLLCPRQEKALEELGFQLPEPDKKRSKVNNRKAVFDKECRELLFAITDKHKLELDKDPVYGGRKYLEKQDYIIQKQNEMIASGEDTLSDIIGKIYDAQTSLDEKTEKLEEMNLKISDVDSLIEEVTDIAYEKAAEIITEEVIADTRKKDLKFIDEMRNDYAESPKVSENTKSFAKKLLDSLEARMKKAFGMVVDSVKKVIAAPETKQRVKQAVKEETRTSIMARMAEAQRRVQEDDERRRGNRKINKGIER